MRNLPQQPEVDIKVDNKIVRSVRHFYENPPLAHQLLWNWKEIPTERLRGLLQKV